MKRPENRSTGVARQVLAWSFDTWGRVQIRLAEDGDGGLRGERVVNLQLSDVPGAAAAFERLRVLLEQQISPDSAAQSPPKAQ